MYLFRDGGERWKFRGICATLLSDICVIALSWLCHYDTCEISRDPRTQRLKNTQQQLLDSSLAVHSYAQPASNTRESARTRFHDFFSGHHFLHRHPLQETHSLLTGASELNFSPNVSTRVWLAGLLISTHNDTHRADTKHIREKVY